MLTLNGVDDALVLVKPAADGDKRLVAYIICKDSEQLNADTEGYQQCVDDLRQQLAQRLPDYMVPAAFVFLDAWPLTANGKTDLRALPLPDMSRQQAAYVAPVTATETALCGLWQDALGLERVGVTDNFFELGGHSLLAVQLTANAEKVGLSVSARQVFATATLAELAKVVDESAAQPTQRYQVPAKFIADDCRDITPEMLPLVNLSSDDIATIASQIPGHDGDSPMANIQDIYPLGPLQQGILFHHMMNKGHHDTDGSANDPYILNAILAVNSQQLLDELQQSLQLIINRHDVLRTAIIWQGLENPVQVVTRQAKLVVDELMSADAADLPDEAQAVAMLKARPLWMDLTKAPLLSLTVLPVNCHQRDGQRYLVQLNFHHIISDHVSLEVIQTELAMIQAGQFEQLPTPPGYREFIGHTMHQAEHHDAEAFFGGLLGDVDEPTAPLGLIDIQGDGCAIAEYRQRIPDALSDAVIAQAKALKVSPAVLFHCAWAMVVGACSNRDDVVFGSVMSGRLEGVAGAANMLGLFINTLPVRVKLADVSATELVRQVEADLHALVPYEQASLATAQRCSGVSGGAPLFSALLNYRHGYDDISEQADAGAIEVVSVEERNNYPFRPGGGQLQRRFCADDENRRRTPRSTRCWIMCKPAWPVWLKRWPRINLSANWTYCPRRSAVSCWKTGMIPASIIQKTAVFTSGLNNKPNVLPMPMPCVIKMHRAKFNSSVIVSWTSGPISWLTT